jgi:hypothetical protein
MAGLDVLDIMPTLFELAVHPDANQRPSRLPKESTYQYSVT